MRLIALPNSSESVTAVVRDRRRNQFSGSISILCNRPAVSLRLLCRVMTNLGFLGLVSLITIVNSFQPCRRMINRRIVDGIELKRWSSSAHLLQMNFGESGMDDFGNLGDDDPNDLFSNGVMYVGDGRAESESDRFDILKNGKSYLFAPEPVSGETEEPINGDPINAKDLGKKSKLMEIPLMPFEAPLFPGSREFLFIYEMRFRSLMQGAQAQKLIGRCFISEDDQIGSIGTLCRIVENRKLESGKGFYVIEGYRRFRIVSIKQRIPYIIAVVDLDWEDEKVSVDKDIDSVISLWNSIYVNLKIYLRVARLHLDLMRESGEAGDDALGVQAVEISRLQREIDRIETRISDRLTEEGDEEKLAALQEAVAGFRQMAEREAEEAANRRERGEGDMEEGEAELRSVVGGVGDEEEEEYEFLSPEVRDTKPPTDVGMAALSEAEIVEKATTFSHAVANLLSTDEYALQQLLQSTCLLYRLRGLKASLDEALEDVEDAMRGSEMEQHITDIGVQARRADDDDSDLMPPPEYEGVTLDSMLDEELLKELDEKDTVLDNVPESIVTDAEASDSDESRVYSIQQTEQGNGNDPEGEDDIWSADSIYAFQ